MRRPLAVAASLALSLASGALAQGSGAPPPDLARIRAALEKYRDPIVAVHDGYFSTVACVDYPTASGPGQMQYPIGGMGVHFLNVSLIGPQVDTLHPQVLIYEPRGERLELVAAEWFVPTQVTQQRPVLFGHDFEGPMEGHHPVMPVELHHWDLHVWLWKDNPGGTFSPTNPNLRCPDGAAYTFHDHAPRMVEAH